MPYASPEARRANSARWYAVNRTQHIQRVLARRKTGLRIKIAEQVNALPLDFDERHALAICYMRRWNSMLWDKFRDDFRQEAAIIAIESKSFEELSRAAGRAAWRMRRTYL